MTNDALTEFALMFKSREPKTALSITTGIVISPPPRPKIMLDDIILLESQNLVFAAHLLSGYERRLKFKDVDWGVTTEVNDGGQGASNHKHFVNLKDEDTLVEWTDTLKQGDEVVLVPVQDGQVYYVMSRAVRF